VNYVLIGFHEGAASSHNFFYPITGIMSFLGETGH
jgi:hypothetical protein